MPDDDGQICTRCICDSTFPNIKFDEDGVCNFCHVHDKLDAAFPVGAAGKRILEATISRVKREGRGKPYDCLIGISGGRDSTYLMFLLKQWNLRPLAIHFNDGFGNPVAGENMTKVTKKLGIDFRVITSDWRESKDLKIAFLKSSTPDLEEATDIGIGAALFGAAVKENVRWIFLGHSFRTEGISPLEWNYMDGDYLKDVHRRFGRIPMRRWKADDPGFHLGVRELLYYTLWRRIRTVPVYYYLDYVRDEADQILTHQLDWVYPGAHYYDDLYQALMAYYFRVKFGIDRRKFNYSALVRSGQMTRKEAQENVSQVYVIEDPKVIDLCIKRLGLTRERFDEFVAAPPKTFRDYRSSYDMIKRFRLPIRWLCQLGVLPGTTYAKYFECG